MADGLVWRLADAGADQWSLVGVQIGGARSQYGMVGSVPCSLGPKARLEDGQAPRRTLTMAWLLARAARQVLDCGGEGGSGAPGRALGLLGRV